MKNAMMEYKGYCGSAEVSVEDGCLSGRVQFIADLVAYAGETFAELERNFRDAVDGYLAFCEEKGREPAKACSGSFNVRIGPDLHRAAVVAAGKEGKSLNEFVKLAVRDRADGMANPKPQIHLHQHFAYESRADFAGGHPLRYEVGASGQKHLQTGSPWIRARNARRANK
jgi:predicted HicB family RNase H-like nuclease